MGVKVINRQYKNQFYPTTQETDWLLGNVGDWQRLEVTFEVTIDFFASQQESVSIDTINNAFILNNGKAWQDYGFDIGDNIVLTYLEMTDTDGDGTYTEVPVVMNFNATNIYQDTMEVDIDLDFGVFEIIPSDRGTLKIKDVKFETLKEPEGLKFRYSHISNADYQSDNLISFIDGSTTEFSFAGLNNLVPNINVLMNPDGIQSGMAIERVYIKKLSGSSSSYDEILGLNPPAQFRLSTRLVQFFNQILVFAPRMAFSIPMNRQQANPDFQNPVMSQIPIEYTWSTGNAGDYQNGTQNQMFLFNSQSSGLKYFDVDVSFQITNTNDNSNSDKVTLVLLRYSTGSSLNFQQRIEIATWNNANDLEGNTLTFSGVMAANVNNGDSLCFGIEYDHPPQTNERWVDISVNSCLVRAIPSGGSGGSVHTYKATVDFMIASFFEQPSNLADRVAPSILFNAGSLTDNFEIEVFPEWNNPNTSISNDLDHTERLGNTGWFDENFNGLDNNFEIESVNYYDDNGNALQQLDYANPVNVEVIVAGIDNLTSASEFGLGFAWIPQDEDDYHNKMTPFHHNLYINTGREYTNGLNDSFNLGEATGSTVFDGNTSTLGRMDIQATDTVLFSAAGTNKARMRARFIPTADFTAEFEAKSENDRKYILWLSTANQQLQINFSDRVSLLLDYQDMIKVIPPAGPFPGMTNRFIEHPQSDDVAGVEKYFGFIEDDVLARVGFKINTQDNKVVRSMSFGYEVENTDTGLAYQLEKYTVNLTQFPVDANGVQNFNVDETRGFKLVDGNNKNWVKIFRNDANDDGNNKAYRAFFATKIRWEDWIARDGVPMEFFNNALANNGYHNDWLDYLRAGQIGQYKFNFFVLTEVIDNGEFKLHKNTFDLTFNDYDENLNIETDHKFFRHSDNTLLNIGTDPITGKPLGVLLDNEPTRIEITYTNLTEAFDISKMYAVTTLEIDQGAGEFEHRQLSSVWLSENDNFLIPLPGQTKLKFEQIAPNVVKATCLTDNNRLQNALRYKVSGRIGCFPEGTGNETGGKYEERYQDLYE